MTTPARIAVVTGGNRGIGFEICRLLGESGIHVIATSRDAEQGDKACARLREGGVDAEPFTLDVCNSDQVRALAQYIAERHGGVDILVNNAGVALSGFDGEVARLTIATNFTAPLALCDALLPIMRPGGRVVMVSSGMSERSLLSEELAGRFEGELSRAELVALMDEFVSDVTTKSGAGKWPTSAYRVSKIGINKLTEVLAAELDARGNPNHILVNAACPGWVRTDMGGPHAPRTPEEGADTPVWLALLDDDGPQGGFYRDRSPVNW